MYLSNREIRASKPTFIKLRVKFNEMFQNVQSIILIRSQQAEETIYMCKWRKHFIHMKSGQETKFTAIRFNQYQILMMSNKQTAQPVKKTQTREISDTLSVGTTSHEPKKFVSFTQGVQAKKKPKKDAKDNQAEKFLETNCLLPQTVFNSDNFKVNNEKDSGTQRNFFVSSTKLTNLPQQGVLVKIEKQYNLDKLSRQLIKPAEVLDSKYILIFKFSNFQESELFQKFQQSFIYYSIHQVLNRISVSYYKQIMGNQLNQYRTHQMRVDSQIQKYADDNIAKFPAGFENIRHIFG